MKVSLIGEVFDFEELVNTIDSNAEEEIQLTVNSVGGDVFAGLQIVNAIQKHGNVVANVEVMSASISAVVTLACKSFTIGKNDLMVLHNCWGLVVGNKEELQDEIEVMSKIDGILHDIILEHCTDAERIEAEMNQGDVFLTGEEVANLFDNCELVERKNNSKLQASAMPNMVAKLKAKLVKEEPQKVVAIEDFNKAMDQFKAEIFEMVKPKEETKGYTMSDSLKELMEFNG